MTSKVASDGPSKHRRAALRQAEGDLGFSVSNFFPIERYYTAADKVLQSFNKAFEEKRLDDAYVLGLRFATFSIESLPQHDYYRASRYAPLKRRNEQNVTSVISKLEQVTMWMDTEEAEKERLRQEYQRQVEAQRQKLQEAKVRKLQQLEEARYKQLQERIEQQRKKSQRGTTQNVEQSAMSKLQLLSSQNGSTNSEHLSSHMSDMNIGSDQRNCKSMSSLNTPSINGEPETSERSSTSRRSRWQQQEEGGSIDAPGSHLGGDSDDVLPPPIPPPSLDITPPPPPPPPSYNQVVAEHGKLVQPTNRRHSSDSMPSIQRTVSAPAGGAIIRSESSDLISFPEAPDEEVLPPPPPYSFFDRDSNRMKTKLIEPVKKIRVPIRKMQELATAEFSRLKQQKKIEVFGLGTYQGRNRNSTNGCTVISPLVVSRHLNSPGSVSDDAIVHVIDKQCPPLLRDIRRKLELEGDALIIPSDVHDYLVDHKILHQEKFSGACGGNILDEDHIGEFLRLLEGGETGNASMKKTGAAFFFHEHVVSIVKVPLGQGRFAYDMVDSMPRLVDAYNSSKMMASRTRCYSLDAFAVLMKWYACGKFSSSNCTYIDRNDWQEMMADLDPRVFQAFVWTE
jgi:hypothetical protein